MPQVLERLIHDPSSEPYLLLTKPEKLPYALNVAYGLEDITGLGIGKQIHRYVSGYNEALDLGKTSEQARELSRKNLEADLRTWIREYPQMGTVLPRLIAQNEQDEIVNSVDGVLIIDQIDERERSGAVLQASINENQFFARQKQNGDMLIINSPPGWNGLYDDYLDHQLIVGWRENGRLRGATLVTDLNVDQAKQLSLNLGVSPDLMEGEDEYEEISNIVKNPAQIKRGSQRFKSLMDIAKAIFEIRGEGDFRFELPNGTIKTVPISDMRRDINRLDNLLKFNEAAEEALAQFRQILLDNEENMADFATQRFIAEQLRITALKATRALRPKNLSPSYSVSDTRKENLNYIPAFINQAPKNDNFEAELYFLQTQTMGCAGRAVTKRSFLKSFTSSSILGSVGLADIFQTGVIIGNESGESKFCRACGSEDAICGWCKTHAHLAA